VVCHFGHCETNPSEAGIRHGIEDGVALFLTPESISVGSEERPYNHSSIGVVMTPSTHGGPHRLVDEHGKDREVYKRHPEAAPSPFSEAYDGKIVVVGHDEEWVRIEEDVCRRRQELSRSHQTAAWRHIVEARREEQEDG